MTAALSLTGVGPIVAATAKKTTSGSSSFLLILIVIGAAFYFLIYRPQQKKARALREVGNSFEVGDEVLTAGGIVGYVIEIDGDRVTLETSVGASFVVLRQYVLRKIEPPVEDDGHEGGSYDEGEYDEADHDEHGHEHEPEHDEHDEHDHDDADHDAAEAADDAESHPASGGTESANGKGSTPGTTTSADGDDAGGHNPPPII